MKKFYFYIILIFILSMVLSSLRILKFLDIKNFDIFYEIAIVLSVEFILNIIEFAYFMPFWAFILNAALKPSLSHKSKKLFLILYIIICTCNAIIFVLYGVINIIFWIWVTAVLFGACAGEQTSKIIYIFRNYNRDS